MTVHLVPRGLEQRVGIRGIRRPDVGGAHHPDAHAFQTSRIKITRMLESHPRIGGMQTAGMLVIETPARPNEHFVKGPLMLIFHTDSSRCNLLVAHPLLLRVCHGCFTNPGALFMGAAA